MSPAILATNPIKIFLTSDPHLAIPPAGSRFLGTMAETVQKANPDAVVVAGDLGTPRVAQKAIGELREAVGNIPLAVCLGNHDYWLDSIDHSQFSTLRQIRRRYWSEPCKDVGATLLDEDNLEFEDCVIVGGYGHFDLGIALQKLQIGEVKITREHYLEGGIDGLFWNDFLAIPHCATNLDTYAAEEASGISERLEKAGATGKRIIVAVHTCPWAELNGHPRTGRATDLLAAYSGNSAVGAALEHHADQIDLVACGHTHVKVAERLIAGIPVCLNLGSDYGIMRGVVLDTQTKTLEWVGAK